MLTVPKAFELKWYFETCQHKENYRRIGVNDTNLQNDHDIHFRSYPPVIHTWASGTASLTFSAAL